MKVTPVLVDASSPDSSERPSELPGRALEFDGSDEVVVEFPGVMPLIAEIQIHYRPVLELKEAEHFMYEIRRACCVQELTGAPLVEPGAASRGGKCANSRKSARKS